MRLKNTTLDQDKRLGDYLVNRNIISSEQAKTIADKAVETNSKFGETAINLGMVDDIDILNALSEQQDLPFVDLKRLISSAQP